MTAAQKAFPEDPLYNQGLGIALARNDNPAEGILYLRKALQKRPLDACLLKDMGETNFLDGRYENALESLKGSVSVDSEDPETYYLMGRSQLALNLFSEAIGSLEKVLEKRPDYLQALYYLGEAYGKQGNMGDAHFCLGRYYLGRGDIKNALFHLQQAIRLSPDPVRKEEAEKLLAEARKERAKMPQEQEEQRPTSIKKPRSTVNDGRNEKNAW
jgi:predicted Zn-dependent protease